MITLEKWENDIRAIFGEGNLKYAYDMLPKHLGVELDHQGNVLTYPTLIKQYKRHHDSWDREYGGIEPRFVSKEDREKKKNIIQFLNGKWYQHHFEPRSHPRDAYLFGGVDQDSLTKQRIKFEEEFKTRKL